MREWVERLMRRVFRVDDEEQREARTGAVNARMDAAVAEHQQEVKPEVDRMRRLYGQRMDGIRRW